MPPWVVPTGYIGLAAEMERDAWSLVCSTLCDLQSAAFFLDLLCRYFNWLLFSDGFNPPGCPSPPPQAFRIKHLASGLYLESRRMPHLHPSYDPRIENFK